MKRYWAVFPLLAAGTALGGSWPNFRRDVSRTAYSKEAAAPPLTLRWQYAVAEPIFSSPIVAYERVYFGSRTGSVYCLDAYTGALKWSYATGNWVDATPAVWQGRLFVPSRNGTLYALDAYTGALLWSYATGSTEISSPLVHEGELYAATGLPNKLLSVFDAKTGALKRSVALTQFTASSPVLDPATGRVFLGTSDGRYNAYASDLAPLWSSFVQTRGGINIATPALADGKLITIPGDDDWRMRAFNPASGFEIWKSTTLCHEVNQNTSVAVSSDAAFGGSGCDDHSLHSISLSTGGVRWKVPLGAASKFGVASSPGVANDMVYVLSPPGELVAVHTSTGGVRARIALSAGEGLSSPAVSNGWVYAATMGGKVHAFEASRVAAITEPDQILGTGEGLLTVKGTAAGPDLQSWKLEWGAGAAPASWTTISTGTTGVTRGALGTWDTREYETGTYSLRLSVTESPASDYLAEAHAVFSIAQSKSVAVSSTTATTVKLGDETEIEIPAGAIEGTDIITVTKVSGTSALALRTGSFPIGVKSLGIVREFKLGNNPKPKFLKPVTLKIPYNTASPANEENVRMMWLDDSGRWQPINTSLVRKGEKRVWAEVDHFTNFGLTEFTPSDTLITDADVYAAPNPARGSTVIFKFRVADHATVTVRVYDVAGNLIGDLHSPLIEGAKVGTLTWDIGGKASGVYVFHVEATGLNGRKTRVIKKFAIIH